MSLAEVKSRVLLGEHSTMKVVSCVRRGVVSYMPLLTLWRMSAVRVRLPPTARDVLNNYFHFLLYVVWSFSKEMILCKIYQVKYIKIYRNIWMLKSPFVLVLCTV